MSALTPVVVVPGFYGFALEGDDPPDECEPGQLLELLWLSLLEGREERPGRYLIALPEEGVLAPEFPPDESLDAFPEVLPDHAEQGMLHCFAYDWRKDLTATAARLAAEIADFCERSGHGQVDLVGIGPGALVCRYLVESRALSHAAGRVRRSVLIGAPNFGIPAGLLLLNGLCSVFEPAVAMRRVLDEFPAAVQLLPPRGAAYLYLAGGPGMRLEPFSWPEAFLAGGGAENRRSRSRALEPVLRDLAACNDAVYTRLKTGFDPSWRRTLVIASASEATFFDLHLRMEDTVIAWERLRRVDKAGDGLVPIAGAVPHPALRTFLTCGRHRELTASAAVREQLPPFLRGPLA